MINLFQKNMKTCNRFFFQAAVILFMVSLNSCVKDPVVQRLNGKDVEKPVIPSPDPSGPNQDDFKFTDIHFDNSISLRNYPRLEHAYLCRWEGDKYNLKKEVDVFTISFYTGDYITGSSEFPDNTYFKDKGEEVCLRFIAPRYTKNTEVFAISSGTFKVSADPANLVVLSGYVTETDRDGKTLDIPSYVFEQKSSNVKDYYFGFIDGGKMQVFFDDPVYTFVMDFKAGQEEIKYYFQGEITLPKTKTGLNEFYRDMPLAGNQYSKFLSLSAR